MKKYKRETRNIYRIWDEEKKVYGYRVEIMRHGIKYYRFFSFSNYTSKEETLLIAKEYRDNLKATLLQQKGASLERAVMLSEPPIEVPTPKTSSTERIRGKVQQLLREKREAMLHAD